MVEIRLLDLSYTWNHVQIIMSYSKLIGLRYARVITDRGRTPPN